MKTEQRLPAWALRAAEDDDRTAILALEEAGIRAAAEALWGTWRPSATPEELDLTGHEMVVAGPQILGCIQVLEHPDHMQIAKLYLAAPARGTGLGAALLTLKKDLARHRDLSLRVRELTTKSRARAFYEREGFRLISETAERWVWDWSPDPSSARPVTKP
ncbi:MAG: GNAT family N-acetyltransferase [Pseudomonadota bacterium]